MMLGSFRFMGPGLLAEPPVGHPPPKGGRSVNFRPGAGATAAGDEGRTGPWMGHEVEGRWTGWWGGRSPSAVSAPGWYWPELGGGKLKRGRGTWGWEAGLVGPAGLLLLRVDCGELEPWAKGGGPAAGCGEYGGVSRLSDCWETQTLSHSASHRRPTLTAVRIKTSLLTHSEDCLVLPGPSAGAWGGGGRGWEAPMFRTAWAGEEADRSLGHPRVAPTTAER